MTSEGLACYRSIYKHSSHLPSLRLHLRRWRRIVWDLLPLLHHRGLLFPLHRLLPNLGSAVICHWLLWLCSLLGIALLWILLLLLWGILCLLLGWVLSLRGVILLWADWWVAALLHLWVGAVVVIGIGIVGVGVVGYVLLWFGGDLLDACFGVPSRTGGWRCGGVGGGAAGLEDVESGGYEGSEK